MAENQKQKLNKINLLKNIVYSAIGCSYANCTFAVSKEENLSDEIFNAAMQVQSSSDDYNSITNVVDSQAASNAAEQIDTTVAGNNVLHNAVNGLQNIGSSLCDNINTVTGNNPLVTKLLVVFILVFISICIIIVLILLAKKFVFKKTVNPFVTTKDNEMDLDEEFDESKFEDDELPYADDDDELMEEEQNTEPKQKRISHTMIPPKSMIEHDEETESKQKNIVQDGAVQETVALSKEELRQEQDMTDTVILPLNDDTTAYQRITEPKDIASAMQVFLKVTAE